MYSIRSGTEASPHRENTTAGKFEGGFYVMRSAMAKKFEDVHRELSASRMLLANSRNELFGS
jgi:hypothetical protein